MRPNVNDYRIEDDGITHINIYSNGQTELGRRLSNFEAGDVETLDGTFASIEAYYHWLKCSLALSMLGSTELFTMAQYHAKLSALRLKSGVEAQLAGRSLRKYLEEERAYFIDRPTEDFTQRIRYALFKKITGDEKLMTMYLSNELPLTHYYRYNNNKVHKAHFDWLPDLITDLYDDVEAHYAGR